MDHQLSLAEAIKQGRLEEFVARFPDRGDVVISDLRGLGGRPKTARKSKVAADRSPPRA
jgi:hypothetical protein